MTNIEFAFSRFFPGKTELKDGGRIKFKPTKKVSLGNETVFPDPFVIEYGKETFIIDVPPTAAGWAWEITVVGKFSAYYDIPKTDNTIPFNTLRPLDPDTLEQGDPDPAWLSKLDNLIEIGIVGPKGEPGKDSAIPGPPGKDSTIPGPPGKPPTDQELANSLTNGGEFTTALTTTISELSGPVIDQKVAPALDIVARANAGEFNGADGAPGNATMRIDTTVGTRVFITDGITEHMISGDTGIRNIASLAATTYQPAIHTLNLQRFGNMVTISGKINGGIVSNPGSFLVPTSNIPTGFRYRPSIVDTQFIIRDGGGRTVSMTTVSGGTGFSLTGFDGTHIALFTFTYQTQDPWPTTLPGTPT